MSDINRFRGQWRREGGEIALRHQRDSALS